jgi:hypothetical protein
MQGKITRVAVTWTEDTDRGARYRFYGVMPDKNKIINPDELREFIDRLAVICQQIQAARDANSELNVI